LSIALRLNYEITGLSAAFLNLLLVGWYLEFELSFTLHIELTNEDADDDSDMEEARRLSKPSSFWLLRRILCLLNWL